MLSFWMDGKIIKQRDSFINLELGALHYGSAVFDGILAIKTREEGIEKVALFKVQEHIDRLFKSAKMLGLDLAYSREEVLKIIKKMILFNGLNNYYIRPILFDKADYLKLISKRPSTSLVILLRVFNFHIFSFKMMTPISLTCFDEIASPFSKRFSSLKASGRYLINILAKRHAYQIGCNDAVLFGSKGNVLETTAANIFILHKDEVVTPPPDNIIDGITRKTAIDILSKMGIKVQEREIVKADLLNSVSIFLTGSATGIVAVKRIDNNKLDIKHSVLHELQSKYLDVISAKDKTFEDCITYA